MKRRTVLGTLIAAVCTPWRLLTGKEKIPEKTEIEKNSPYHLIAINEDGTVDDFDKDWDYPSCAYAYASATKAAIDIRVSGNPLNVNRLAIRDRDGKETDEYPDFDPNLLVNNDQGRPPVPARPAGAGSEVAVLSALYYVHDGYRYRLTTLQGWGWASVVRLDGFAESNPYRVRRFQTPPKDRGMKRRTVLGTLLAIVTAPFAWLKTSPSADDESAEEAGLRVMPVMVFHNGRVALLWNLVTDRQPFEPLELYEILKRECLQRREFFKGKKIPRSPWSSIRYAMCVHRPDRGKQSRLTWVHPADLVYPDFTSPDDPALLIRPESDRGQSSDQTGCC